MLKLLLFPTLFASAIVGNAQSSPVVNLQQGAVITLPAGAIPNALAIMDFNQDSRNDVAVCQRGLGSVGVYLQTTGGNFPNPAVGIYSVGQGPTGVVAVGLTPSLARGAIDLVAISPISGHYTLLTNNEDGSGTFTPVINTWPTNSFGTSNVSVNPQLTAANVDGNLTADLIYTYDPPQSAVEAGVYWKEVSTTIAVAHGYKSFHRPGYRPSSMALADFDRDGALDLVMTNPTGNAFTVVIADRIYGTSTPRWGAASARSHYLPSGGTRPVSVAAADVNRDYLPDIALAHEGSAEITLFLNLNNSQFGAQFAYPVSGAPRQVLLTDLNGDGSPELLALTSDNKLQVFQHTGATGANRYGTPLSVPTGLNPVTMQVADMDGDYKPDVVVACAGDNTVRVYLNRSVLASRAPQLQGVAVYPNPATDQLTLTRTTTLRGPVTATLWDALGRQVRRAQITAPTSTLSVADLPRGVYMLRLAAAEGTLNQRIVVQ